MPRSADEGKSWTVNRILALDPPSILDIGPGWGTYARLLRPHLPNTHFTGIEIFAPYIDKYDLTDWYDVLYIADARELPFPDADVVILGDVIEHCEFDEALDMWTKARGAARLAVLLSLPIIEYVQGTCEGNVSETHLHTWDHEMVLRELDGISESQTYSQIGVYKAVPL